MSVPDQPETLDHYPGPTSLHYDPEARDWVATLGFSLDFGDRVMGAELVAFGATPQEAWGKLEAKARWEGILTGSGGEA